MADEQFDGVAIAMDVQSAFGTRNGTIEGLSGSLNSTDGFILGVRDAGDADSGVTLPQFVPDDRERPPVAESYTERADDVLRILTEGLAISFPLMGNGVTSTPTTDQAKPHLGIDAFFEMLGLAGASGTDPLYEYTPRATTVYGTIKVWTGDLSFVFGDCMVESASIIWTPGGNAIVTGNIRVGNHDPTADFADGVTFPTVDYTTQESISAPVVEGITFNNYGLSAGSFETLTVNIANVLAEFGDSAVAVTGKRLAQTRRTITVDGTVYVVTADSDAEYQATIATAVPTADLSFQLGTVAGPAATLNAALVEVNNLQGKGLKYNRGGGDVLVAELSGAKATGTTAGTEFKLTFN